MSQTALTPEIKAIREVRSAARKLDAACTHMVGHVEMRIGKENIEALAEPIPEDMLKMAASIQKRLDGLN